MIERYHTIAADPPWLECGGGQSKRGADRHYPLMSKKDIVVAMRDSGVWRPAGSCHLWLWATSNHLPDALWLMQVLEFEYKTSAVWVKAINSPWDDERTPFCDMARVALQIGLGQYMRHAHEWLLLGTRGEASVPPPKSRRPSVIFAPRKRHSEKPSEAYDLIESVSPGPRLEMFARQPRDGWTVWGNQIQETQE